MRALVVTCQDPFRPAHHRQVVQHRRPRKISALAPKGNRPVICAVNGRWQPRAAWGRRLRDGDVVAFVVLPQGGGGGSNPLRLVLSLAISFWAPWAAGQLLGTNTVASALSAIGMSSQTFVGIASGAISLVANGIVNALIPAPKPPSGHQSAGLATPSPTYSLSAQGNSARLGQPIPVLYGRHMIYPDFGAMPYAEFAGNEQFLYQLLVLGQGEYDIEAIRIEDTPVSSFEEITYEIIPPGGQVTLFPSRVVTSVEVAGQEALTSTTLGPFVASAAGDLCDTLGVDVVMPKGLYYANDDGGLTAIAAAWKVEARAIDDLGAPVGGWFVLGTQSKTAATTTPIRLSFRYGVPLGRYEVRFTRTNTKETDSRYGHDLNWSGLRAYLPGQQMYGNVTLVAMRMRSSNNLSGQASRKVNMIVTRKLQTWTSGVGWSVAATPTRSIAWAIADMLRATYGGELPDGRVDLDGLAALDTAWAARGDTFDAVFDSQGTVMESVGLAARAGRAIPYQQGGLVYVVRDEAASLPVALFSQRNIVRNSVKLDYIMPSDETADAVDVTYFDSAIWAERTVRAALPGAPPGQKPYLMKIFGATNRDQAWREGMYAAACNRYRRRFVTFSTEMEGLIPAPGDLIAVQHDTPRWGQSGEIVAWDAATLTATLSDPLDWSAAGPHSLAFRTRRGGVCGPFSASPGADAHHVLLLDWVLGSDPDPDTGPEWERAHYAFGPTGAQYIRCRVLGLRPRSSEIVEVSAVVESDYVHTADTGSAPTASAWQLPATATAPVVVGLSGRSMLGAPDKMILSWQPSAGADHYLIEQGNGSGEWVRCGETAAANYTATALYGAETVVRVAAVGMVRGPWVSINYSFIADYFWTSDAALMWTSDGAAMWRY